MRTQPIFDELLGYKTVKECTDMSRYGVSKLLKHFWTLFQISGAKTRQESIKLERKVSRGAKTPDLPFFHYKIPAIPLLLGFRLVNFQN